MNFQAVMTQVSRFNNEETARDYAERKAGRWVILGDNGEYWVAMRKYAEKLVAMGYSYAD